MFKNWTNINNKKQCCHSVKCFHVLCCRHTYRSKCTNWLAPACTVTYHIVPLDVQTFFLQTENIQQHTFSIQVYLLQQTKNSFIALSKFLCQNWAKNPQPKHPDLSFCHHLWFGQSKSSISQVKWKNIPSPCMQPSLDTFSCLCLLRLVTLKVIMLFIRSSDPQPPSGFH